MSRWIPALFLIASACGDDAGDSAGTSGTTAATEATDATGTETEGTSGTTGSAETIGGPGCGNGKVEADEECDDADNIDGDFCSADCLLPVELVWSVMHDGGDADEDYAGGVLVDPSGDILVLGTETQAATTNLWLRKLDPDGNEIWTHTVAGDPNGAGAEGWHLAWHPSDDVLVVGSEADMAFVQRLTPSDPPVEVWRDTGFDLAAAEADADGNVIAVGAIAPAVDEPTDLWIQKYDADGGVVWTQTHPGDAMLSDGGYAVAVAATGNLYVLGIITLDEEEEEDEQWVVALDSDGGLLWSLQGDEVPWGLNSLLVDSAGDVLVGGEGEGGIFVGKLDPGGMEIWSSVPDPFDSNLGWVSNITLDAEDNVYAVGTHARPNEIENVWMGRIDADGVTSWTASYNNADSDLPTENGFDIALAPDGHYVVVGDAVVLGEGNNIWIAKYLER